MTIAKTVVHLLNTNNKSPPPMTTTTNTIAVNILRNGETIQSYPANKRNVKHVFNLTFQVMCGISKNPADKYTVVIVEKN